jgi:predicted  nucleic acid-binding Zn-ribbon protein
VSDTALSDAADVPRGVVPPTLNGGSKVLSDVLVELGFASREVVEEAVRAAQSPGKTVAAVLVESGAISEAQLARATAERHGVDYVDLAGFSVEVAATALIKPAAARRYQAVPVARIGDSLLVAMADPADTLAISDLGVMTRLEVRPAVAARAALEALLEALPLGDEGWEGGANVVDEAPAVEDEPPAPDDEPPADAARLREELDALKDQLSGAEDKLRGERRSVDAAEVDELRGRLAAAEAELEEARVRVRESKEVWAEVDSLREKLQAAEAGLDQASARAKDGDAVAAEAGELRGEVGRLRQERDYLRSELRRVGADADVRTNELETLRGNLTEAETELVRVRAESGARGAELEAQRSRIDSAEREADEAVRRASDAEARADGASRRVAELEREVAESRRLAEELAAADARAEQARLALAQLREESERERERAAMAERGLREKLVEEERRRTGLEGRLDEVKRRVRDALDAADRPDAG